MPTHDEIRNAACEAMRWRVYREFYDVEDYTGCGRVSTVDAPPIPPRYADSPQIEGREPPDSGKFTITESDIGRYVRRISTGAIGRVRRDPGNGWLHPMEVDAGPQYEWQAYRDDLEYVAVAADPPPVGARVKGSPHR